AKKFPDISINFFNKINTDVTYTKYYQSCISFFNDFENDSFQKHIQDTLIAGAGLCDEEVVELVIKEGAERVKEIIDWGTNFDKNNEGEYMRGKEGGHSENRILHHKDITGYEIERALIAEV